MKTNMLLDWLVGPDPVAELKRRKASGWLAEQFPEIHVLYGIPQTAVHHPEIDTGIHVELVLEEACKLTTDPSIRFAALTHDLGKGKTDPAILPRHHGHEDAGVPLVKGLQDRFDLPEAWIELGTLVAKFHLHAHRAFEGPARGTIRFFRDAQLFERPQLLEPFLLACLADKWGRAGLQGTPYRQADYLREAFALAQAVPFRLDEDQTHSDRIRAIHRLREQYPAPTPTAGSVSV